MGADIAEWVVRMAKKFGHGRNEEAVAVRSGFLEGLSMSERICLAWLNSNAGAYSLNHIADEAVIAKEKADGALSSLYDKGFIVRGVYRPEERAADEDTKYFYASLLFDPDLPIDGQVSILYMVTGKASPQPSSLIRHA
jgi:hypothetical protein